MLKGLYAQFLAKGKDAIDAMELPFKVRKEKKQLELLIVELESDLSKAELTIVKEQSTHPINWDNLLAALDSRDLKERKLKQYKELEDKLFNQEVPAEQQ